MQPNTLLYLLERGRMLLLFAHQLEQVLSLEVRGPRKWGRRTGPSWTLLPLVRPSVALALVASCIVRCRRRRGSLRGGKAVAAAAGPTGCTRRTLRSSLPGGLLLLCDSAATLFLFVLLLRLPARSSRGRKHPCVCSYTVDKIRCTCNNGTYLCILQLSQAHTWERSQAAPLRRGLPFCRVPRGRRRAAGGRSMRVAWELPAPVTSGSSCTWYARTGRSPQQPSRTQCPVIR